jgi:hypothetical protein
VADAVIEAHWPLSDDTVEDLRLELHVFQRQDHETWLMGRQGYKTPAQVRYEQRWPLTHVAEF